MTKVYKPKQNILRLVLSAFSNDLLYLGLIKESETLYYKVTKISKFPSNFIFVEKMSSIPLQSHFATISNAQRNLR